MAIRPAPPSDALSLTLPDWRSAAKKIRRWKPPRPKDWWWACVAGWSLWAIVVGVLSGDVGVLLFCLVYHGLTFAVAWRWMWKGPPKIVPWPLPGDEQKRPPERIDYWCVAWLAFYLVVAWAFSLWLVLG